MSSYPLLRKAGMQKEGVVGETLFPYAESLLEKLQYHTKLVDSRYSIEYLKKINSKLDENNYLTYAYLATNPALSVEEREVYRKCMEELYKQEEIIGNQIKELKAEKPMVSPAPPSFSNLEEVEPSEEEKYNNIV